MALKNNSKYVKAMERRARTLRKQAEKLKKKEDIDKEGLEDIVLKLKTSLEDCTGVCILEGFQKQEPMILVDAILKELGKMLNQISIPLIQPTGPYVCLFVTLQRFIL